MQARLRAQRGDRSEYSGERRRRSVVVASIVLTITDPLRGSYPFWCYLQAALIRSCGASFACMELTIISRFQRLRASTKSLLHSLFVEFVRAFAEGMSLRYNAIWHLHTICKKKIFLRKDCFCFGFANLSKQKHQTRFSHLSERQKIKKER